jgi:four helix bundle protein
VKYGRFEDLPVWKAGSELLDRIYEMTKDRAFRQPGDLLDQLRRAALSVSNNIAEGFERGTTSELLTYLYYARGSAGEVRSMLHFCERLAEMKHLNQQVTESALLAESCSRQLRAWADSLQDGDIQGQRHLNEQSRRAYEATHRSRAFLQKLEEDQQKRMAERQRVSVGAEEGEQSDHERAASSEGQTG